MDRDWWDRYIDEVNATFEGARFSNNQQHERYRVHKVTHKCFANSGAGCVATAVAAGAKKIILLGFDCQKTDGKSHWHGDHPKGLGNANKIELWGDKFRQLAQSIPQDVEVINASRQTALTVFPRGELEAFL